MTLLLLASSASSSGQAEGWFKLDSRAGSDGMTMGVGGNNWFGVARLTSTGYRQFYTGPVFKIGEHVTMGAGIGVERTQKASWGLRYAAFTNVRYETLTLSLSYEDGNVTGFFIRW